jgi:hypothetical protein
MADLSKSKRLEVGNPFEPDGKRIDQSGAKDYRQPDAAGSGITLGWNYRRHVRCCASRAKE